MIKNVSKFWEYDGGRMVLAAICAHSISISIGFTQGYSAILLPQLKETEKFKNLTTDQTSWIASFGAISTPIGSVLSGVMAEYFGRKRSMQISCLPFILGWICLGLAQNINWLYAGRLITGVAGGMSTACYTYVGEISTPENRGIMQTLGPICASMGILLTYVLGYCLNWSTVAYICISFGFISAIAIQFQPESPSYLFKYGRQTEGFEVLLWLRRNNAVAQLEMDRFDENQKSNDIKNAKLRDIFLAPQTIKPFMILVGLFLLQEFSGIYTLLYYAVSFFQETDPDLNEYVASIIVGVIRLVVSIVAAVLINKYGRRILCILSSFGMAVSMLTVAIYVLYYELNPDHKKILTYLPLIGIIFNVVFSMVGMLPIPWIMVGEMFPLQVRPIMCGIVICLAQIFIFICVKIYNNMISALNFSGTLLVFVGASVLAIAFCIFILPETKNKSLEDIEAYFRKKVVNLDGIDNSAFVSTPEDVDEKNKDVFAVTLAS